MEIRLDKSKIRHYGGTADGERMKELEKIYLRMVKVYLENKNTEIAELYHMWWGIMQISAYGDFTGTKPVLLLHIYNTIYVSNLAEDIIRDAEREIAEKEYDRKHKMIINKTVSISILKNDLIYTLLETDKEKKKQLFQQLYDISVRIWFLFVRIVIIIEQKDN